MTNVYEEVTNRILKALERGVAPWVKPWTGTVGPTNLVSRRPYRGVNVLLLGLSSQATPFWLTYRQAEALGGHVKAGEHGTRIYFWKPLPSNEAGTDEDLQVATRRQRLISRAFTVFNVDQCEGIEAPALAAPLDFKPVEAAEELLSGITPRPVIQTGGDQAYFKPSADLIMMPPKEGFASVEAYYSTLFHELVHWSGHQDRLARPTLARMSHFGDEQYSREELIAEMGAGFLCALTGIENTALERNRAAYIANWLQALQDDRKLVVSAAGHAQRAVDFLCARTPTNVKNQEGAPLTVEVS